MSSSKKFLDIINKQRSSKKKEKYPDPLNKGEFYKFKMDIKNIKRFDKMCFMDAAEEIGLFDVE